MERIVLEVNDNVARKWRRFSPLLRMKLNELIAGQIDQIPEKSEPEDSIRFFDELRTEMKNKGLTQEILNEILHDA
jgi:hypothetical protein